MRYKVIGVDRQSGRDVEMTVDTDDHQAAEAQARPQMMVAEVVPVAEPVTYQTPQDEGLAALAAAATSPAQTHFVEVPDYGRIVAGAFVLRLLSGVAYACAAIILILLLVHLVDAARTRVQLPTLPMDSFFEALTIAGYLAGVTAYLMIGALLGLLSSLSLAVRDMARNSFRR